MNTYRYSLRKPHPIKSGVDLRQAKPARIVIAVAYSVSDTFNMTGYKGFEPHKRDLCGVPHTNMSQLRFLKIANNPEAIGIDDGDFCHAGSSVVARAKPEMRDIARDR